MSEDNRSIESLRHQYEVEKDLHRRLMESTRENRPLLFGQLYGELFERVKDHPRLTRRETEEDSRQAVEARMKLLRPYLQGVKTFMEVAPGDCRLAYKVCESVEKVIAIDISDQSGEKKDVPDNFELVIYDGYDLGVPENSVDLAFSYQFLEHIHPEDHEYHFETVHRVLKPGGIYVFDTPHLYSGPHDASRGFSYVHEGMHLKEWTYREMFALVKKTGFREWYTYRFGVPRESGLYNFGTLFVEGLTGLLPLPLRQKLSNRVFKGVTMLARK
jgi:SAM-dependent methyltransferase